jgi:hypothetical protein
MIQIRKAELHDLSAIAGIYQQAHTGQLIGEDLGLPVWVAINKDRVVGYLALHTGSGSVQPQVYVSAVPVPPGTETELLHNWEAQHEPLPAAAGLQTAIRQLVRWLNDCFPLHNN